MIAEVRNVAIATPRISPVIMGVVKIKFLYILSLVGVW